MLICLVAESGHQAIETHTIYTKYADNVLDRSYAIILRLSNCAYGLIYCTNTAKKCYSGYMECSFSYTHTYCKIWLSRGFINTKIAFYLIGLSTPWCCNLAADSSIVKLDIFEVIRTYNIQTYERYLCFLQ